MKLQFARRAAAAIAVAVSAVACAQPNGPGPVAGELPVERLVFQDLSHFEKAGQHVIRNNIEWTFAWARIKRSHSPLPPLPVIDFSKEQIVVAAPGARPTTGFALVITGASSTGGVTMVNLENRSPGPGCGGLTVQTHPVDVVKMPRTTGPVVFEETAEVRTCR